MGLESAAFISELVQTNPVGAVDDYATADDHLRLVKAVLKGQFPNFTAAAMNASVVELNVLDGFTGNTADLNILSGAAAGGLTATELLFLSDVTSLLQAQIGFKLDKAGGTMTGALITDDSDSGGAGFRIPLGVAPSAPTDGDMWLTASSLNARIGGVTKSLTSEAGAEENDLSVAVVWANVPNANITQGSVTQHVAAINHDALQNFVANDHIDHTTINVLGGTGISGGGAINASQTLNLATDTLTDLGSVPTRLMSMPVYNGSAMRRVDMEDLNRITERTFSTSDTLVIADEFGVVRSINAGNVTMTIPPNSSVAFPLGTVIGGVRHGTGTFGWLAGGGVTIRSADSLVAHRAQYSMSSIRKLATDTWLLGGDLA